MTRWCSRAVKLPTESAVHNNRMTLAALALIHVAIVLNMFMCGMALPYIRTSFDLQADTAAWVITIYMLPYLVVMPLYGRLGDRLGKWRVFAVCLVVFLLGTTINLLSKSLPWLLLGRAVQGIGAGGQVPLSIAMISEVFPTNQRGRALGAWNSAGPITGIVGTLAAGVLIDAAGWRLIFAPVLLMGLIALFLMWKLTPAASRGAQPQSLSTFDWGGAALLGGALAVVLLYVSSESVTGVRPLRDWRLASATLVAFGSFVLWEKRQAHPFVNLDMFSRKPLVRASFCAAMRMFTMDGLTFLMPLFLTDVRGFRATSTGLMLIAFYVGLVPTMHLGGRLADRWGVRWPLIAGMALQLATVVFFALLGRESALVLTVIGLGAHGLGAGLAQPALHRKALEGLPSNQMGMAAGLYSMIRFCGTLFGAATAGVVLQQGLERGLGPVSAYHVSFWFAAALGSLGVIVALTVRNAGQRVTGESWQQDSA